MARDLKALIAQMTLEEKAGMCSGADFWRLKDVPRLGIPTVMVSDGPHGLRKQDDSAEAGINDSIKAVCFPTASATAASFDRDLLREMGAALGEECQAEGVSVLLGPAVNIKRSPLCGRNFEYFSEDPYLAGELAASHIKGVQSWNVGTSLKHFAANNQEYRRMTTSAEIDERALREIYLAAFEAAVKQAQPWTVMCSYNKLNGTFASEHRQLLTDILRGEWGFEGYVMSDWGAVNNRVAGLKAGLDLEMPSSQGATDKQLAAAVRAGTLSEAVLDRAVERILTILFRYIDGRRPAAFDRERHHALAVKIEEESAVLLKNDRALLPLAEGQRVAFIGGFAAKPRFQGGGSSHINSFKVSSALETAAELAGVSYAPGFPADRDELDETLFAEAVEAAKNAGAAVIFAGLPDSFESEGYDRSHMRLPDCQNALIRAVCAVQPNTVVVLHNGSPVEMPWVDDVAAILELYLGGQGVGQAAVNLLFGRVNPSGKLPESFPRKLSDNPSYLNFPGDGKRVEYREGIFVGYRYYDKKQMDVLFPFGYGLSYTSFAYTNLRFDRTSLTDEQMLTVRVDVTNTGSRAGKEVVQLYVADRTGTPNRPDKELKGFVKLALEPGETRTAEFMLNKRAFAWYNTDISDWYCASGDYDILIGKSSREIVLEGVIRLTSTQVLPLTADENTTLGELIADPRTHDAVQDAARRFMDAQSGGSAAGEAITEEMTRQMLENAPLRTLLSLADMSQEELDDLIGKLNTPL